MSDEQRPTDETQDEVLQRNIEGSRRIIAEKRAASAAAGGPEPRPEDEPKHGSERPPGHADVPEGGSSGSEMNLGGGYKSDTKPR
ncbi:MAG TPA: hypothetical protein VFI42_04140 [Thermomicrobiaceae bacterium]|nr:hypothetical protein [Thermomicrobiaceae bacterium]